MAVPAGTARTAGGEPLSQCTCVRCLRLRGMVPALKHEAHLVDKAGARVLGVAHRGRLGSTWRAVGGLAAGRICFYSSYTQPGSGGQGWFACQAPEQAALDACAVSTNTAPACTTNWDMRDHSSPSRLLLKLFKYALCNEKCNLVAPTAKVGRGRGATSGPDPPFAQCRSQCPVPK